MVRKIINTIVRHVEKSHRKMKELDEITTFFNMLIRHDLWAVRNYTQHCCVLNKSVDASLTTLIQNSVIQCFDQTVVQVSKTVQSFM